jgi:hypothetical protein
MATPEFPTPVPPQSFVVQVSYANGQINFWQIRSRDTAAAFAGGFVGALAAQGIRADITDDEDGAIVIAVNAPGAPLFPAWGPAQRS